MTGTEDHRVVRADLPAWELERPIQFTVHVDEASTAGRSWQQLRVTAGGPHPGVVIVATSHLGVLLAHHWRPVTDRIHLELPRGFGDSDDAATEALRELVEETGLRGSNARCIGTFYPDTGLRDGRVSVVTIEVDDVQPTRPRDGEVDRIVWLSSDELVQSIQSGAIDDGLSLAALMLSHHSNALPA